MGTAVGCGQRMKTQGAEASSQACRTKVRDLGPERGILRGRQPCVSLMEMREGFPRRRDGIKMYCFLLPGKKGITFSESRASQKFCRMHNGGKVV